MNIENIENKYNKPFKEILKDFIQKDKSQADMALNLGCSKETIRKLISEYGLESEYNLSKKRKKTNFSNLTRSFFTSGKSRS